MSKHNRRWLLVLGMAATCLATPGRVHADASSIEVRMEVKPPDRNNPKTKDDAPQIEATVIGAPNLPAEKFTLREDGAKQPVELKPTVQARVHPGHREARDRDRDERLGDLDRQRRRAARRRSVAVPRRAQGPGGRRSTSCSSRSAGPPGSVGIVITYADSATVRIPMGPLDRITGSALGTQKDYFGTQGVELVKGVDLAPVRAPQGPGVAQGADRDLRRHRQEHGRRQGPDGRAQGARGRRQDRDLRDHLQGRACRATAT